MISIVTSYYNRKNLFYETLLSITRSKYKDIELIAVDDGSSPEHRLENLVEEFPFLKIIRMERENRWYVCSCVLFNIGIREAKGDIVLIQNPECLHIHDVLTYVNENVNDSNYIALSAYGLDPKTTTLLPEYRNEFIVDLLKAMPQRPYTGGSSPGWYNHSIFRRAYFHFCAGITKNNIMKLRGFDERYAGGIAYDDDELIIRIKRMGLNLIIEDNISVFHQYHDSVYWNMPQSAELTQRNQNLILNVTMKENTYEVNQDDNWGKTYRRF